MSSVHLKAYFSLNEYQKNEYQKNRPFSLKRYRVLKVLTAAFYEGKRNLGNTGPWATTGRFCKNKVST